MKRADDGFEDREGHQAPITLHANPLVHGLARFQEFSQDESRSTLVAYGFDNGIGIGELSRRLLGMDLVAIHHNFKHAAARGDQFERVDLLLEFQKLFRQTDGLRLVISSCAILDCNVQWHSSSKSGEQ